MRALRWIVIGLALLMTGEMAAPTAAPVLRIETGWHEGQVTDAATDAAGLVLVTASNDKTARIWSLPDLRPLGVLRPAVGIANEGKLFAVAVSPDGRLAAIGGWTTPTDEQAVLIFDLATKQVVRRIGGLAGTVNALAFSLDGRLAAGITLGGVMVWNTTTWRQAFADPEYKDRIVSVVFAKDGRLAASSYDGGVRLYAPDGSRLARQDMAAQQRPGRLAFNRDGTLLAVGFESATVVEVRDGTTLRLRARPNVTGLANGNLYAVAWAADGHTLLATGDVSDDQHSPILAWSQDGAGQRRVFDAGFADAAYTMLALPDGGAVFAPNRGGLAVLEAYGRRVTERVQVGQNLNTSIELSNVLRRLAVSWDGKQAAWVAVGAPDRWLRFNAADPELTLTDTLPPRLADSVPQAGSLQMTDWDMSTSPKLNGRALPLEQHEEALSVAAIPGQVLLGTHWALRLFDAAGQPRWPAPVALPSDAWRINQSGDGRLAVVALGDGTIRWYRLRDGKEMLALFVTADAQRWVAWMPSGYYAASPDGEGLIGWHVNRGIDQAADFFSAGRFRERFYRPDVVRRALTTLDEAEALRQADKARGSQTRPTQDLPVISILSPADNAEITGAEQVIGYRLRSPSGQRVTAVRAIVNGQTVDARGLDRMPPTPAATDVQGQLTIAIPPGQTIDVVLIAETETRTSEPARIRLRSISVRPPDPLLPRLNVVTIGVSAYANAELRTGVRFAAKDAHDVAAAFAVQRQRGLYREVNIREVTDAQATRAGVMGALYWLYAQTTSNDVAVVFLASHGVDEEGTVFALPVDADPAQVAINGISQTELRNRLSRIPGRVVAFLDLCHAGGAVLARRGLPDMTSVVRQLREPGSGLIVFAAAQASEWARELPELGNGAFTRALLDGLAGAADLNHDGAIRTDELNVYIADRVRELVGGSQHPQMQRPTDVPDFPLIVVPK